MNLDTLLDIKELTANHIDIEKLKGLVREEMEQTDLSKVKNKKSWVKAVVKRLIEENQDELVMKNKVVTTIQLQLRLNELGYSYEAYERYLLELICSHIINEFPVNQKELQGTINKIIGYIEEQKLDKNYKTLIHYLLKSKLVANKTNIPIEEFTTRANKLADEWEEMMNELKDDSHEMTIEEALNYKGE